jgi:DNA-3-methyladenine glycosylase
VNSGRTVLERSFYEAGSVALAPLVLNKLLVRRDRRGRVTMAGRVVEVEAYTGSQDPASHAYKGPTRRNAVMFGPAGHMYVYFTYGMHWCANLVCLPEGIAEAILIRALSPVSGIEAMRAARGPLVTDRNLLSGPARLCQAFGITGAEDGADLVTGDMGLVLMDDGVSPPEKPDTSGRVGIRQATEVQWRWWVPGDPNVSRGRPAPNRVPSSGVTRRP